MQTMGRIDHATGSWQSGVDTHRMMWVVFPPLNKRVNAAAQEMLLLSNTVV